MLVNTLSTPITVFNIEELEINSNVYINHMKDYFYSLEWDNYLLKQNQINFLTQNLPSYINDDKTNDLYLQYYSYTSEDSAINPLIDLLAAEQKIQFNKIQPTRRRSIAQFKVIKSTNQIKIERYYNNSFEQEQAKSISYDWRMHKRIFKQADDAVFNKDFHNLITGLSQKIFLQHPTQQMLDLVVHLTQIVATAETHASNSPEGIHQDGMDYIVSALVIERQNVNGGKSIVFGKDKQSRIFETTLMPGYGLLQPDKGTDLWHTVESIYPQDPSSPAFRSTIGFDFSMSM